MPMKEPHRIGTRRTTLAVLGILKDSTSPETPISIREIVQRLYTEYDISTSRDSVKDILTDLMDYYPGPDKIECTCAGKDGQYRYHFYYRAHRPNMYQENLEKIQEVIRKNKWRSATELLLSFQFNGYGVDQTLHPTGRRYTGVLPLRLIQFAGHPYLVCFFEGRCIPAHLRVDLMTAITVQEHKKILDDQREFKSREVTSVPEAEYLASHLYMYYESPGNAPCQIRLWVKKISYKPEASFTFLHDIFGENCTSIPSTETDDGIEISVRCLPSGITQFVRQYMDRVRVLGPKEIKRRVEDELQRDFDEYFKNH